MPRVNQRIIRTNSLGLTPRPTASRMAGTTNSSSRLAATPQRMMPRTMTSTLLQSRHAREIMKAQF